MSDSVAVVVGLLRNSNGEYWVGQRPQSARYAGKWEFPGGKVESGESPRMALARELREELSIEAEIGRLLLEHSVEYPDGGRFVVRFYLVESWVGTPNGMLVADQAWVDPVRLQTLDLLEGSKPVCEILQSII